VPSDDRRIKEQPSFPIRISDRSTTLSAVLNVERKPCLAVAHGGFA